MVIIKSLSNKDYHAMEGLSKSKMDKLEISPAHYKASLEEPEKQTDALIFGSLFHTMVLEPEKIETEYAVEPVVNKRTNEGKQILSDFYEENKDKTIVTQEQMELAKKMAQKIYEHPIANKLLKAKGDCEISYFWNDDKTDVLLKARPDKVVDDIIIDAKTTAKPNPNIKKRLENANLCIKLFDRLGLSPVARARAGIEAANANKGLDVFKKLMERNDD